MSDLPGWVEEIQEKYQIAYDIAANEVPTCECEMCQYARTDVPRLIRAAAAMAKALRIQLQHAPDILVTCDIGGCSVCGRMTSSGCYTHCGQCAADIARAALAEYSGGDGE